MKSAVCFVVVLPFALLASLLLPKPSQAEVCYDPQARGFGTSRYKLDTLNTDWLSAPIDFTSDPWEVAGSEFLDYSRPEVFAAFERRYGPRTACLGSLSALPVCGGHLFVRFLGPSNEVRSFLADALAWWSVHSPASLGGAAGCQGNGVPSEREITDLQAVSDNAIWEEYHRLALPGGSASRPITICRATQSSGPFSERDTFWGWTNYYLNICGPATPPPPTPTPTPSPACTAPPKTIVDAAKRVRNLSKAKAAGQVVLDWLARTRVCN